MTSFDQLNPALQHHIVNSLGWRELRSFQEEVIPSLLEGKHAIIVAPTAGGKTEAGFFPVVSQQTLVQSNTRFPVFSIEQGPPPGASPDLPASGLLPALRASAIDPAVSLRAL